MNSIGLATMGIKHLKDAVSHNQMDNLAMETNEEIISRLKFIGYIQKDEKIDSRHVSRQPNTWTTTFLRSFLLPDSRVKSLKFVRDVINRSFEILQIYVDKGLESDVNSLIIDLQHSQNGLANLKHTYLDDTKFCCDIDVLLQRINARLQVCDEKNV